MKKLSDFFYRKSTLLVCLIASGTMITYAMVVLGGFSQCFMVEQEQINTLGLSFGYSFQTVEYFFKIRSEPMIRCYQSFILIWDSIFPIIYGLMYILWISLLYRTFQATQFWFINLFPVIQVIFDLLENSIEVMMADFFIDHGYILPTQATLGSILSVCKWVASIITYLILVVGIILIIKKLVKPRPEVQMD